MLGRFDCTELFGTVAGRHEILGGGRPFGVHVGCGDDNNPRLDNCISFGSISQSEIIARSTPAPLGYCEEDGGSPPEWIIQRKLFFMNKSKLRNLTLCEAKFLPNVKSGPQFSLLTDDFQQAEGSVLLQNSLTHFRVQINVGSNKCNEYLGKWLLLCFQGDQPQIKPTEICSVQFIMAVKLSGFCSGDQAGGGKISKLSSESRPFIPKSALNFFDHPVNISGL